MLQNEEEVHVLSFVCSINKSAGQLHGYRAADLRLCFRIYKNMFSHDAAHMFLTYEPRHEKTNVLHMRKQRRRPVSR